MTPPGYVLLLSLLVAVSHGVDKPNIVFMMADDLGWNDVGYHNPDIRTPNIDALAASGVILDQSYVQPQCTPSRTALMTGAYPFTQGLSHLVIKPGQPVCVPLEKKFLPEVLRDNGYATHMVGKWHLGFCNWNCTPTYRGFDSFVGFYTGHEDYYNRMHDEGYDFRYNEEVRYRGNGTYGPENLTNRAKVVINRHVNRDDKDKPLFLYMPFQAPHTPLQTPQEYEDMYPDITNPERKTFSGMVTAMDDAVGAVVQSLKDNGIYNNTIIIWHSDNGGSPVMEAGGNNLPLRGTKLTIFEGGTRVPAFVHSPLLSKAQTGKTYNGMMHMVDWFPTIMEAAGIDYTDPKHDGVSQWKALTTQGPSPRTEFVYNLDPHRHPIQGEAAIRVGDFKLIDGFAGLFQDWYPTTYQDPELTDEEKQALVAAILSDPSYMNQKFLFNLKDDPAEKNNLYESMPDKVAEMTAKLDEYRKRVVPVMYPEESESGAPENFGGIYSPGWC